MSLPILFQDDDLVAIHKPSGLLVHRSLIDRHAEEFAMQMTRDQIGRQVFPVHRLDRPTSGVLLFALSKESARAMSQAFSSARVKKTYRAIVRGWAPDEALVDHPLKEILDRKSDKMAALDKPAQEARTHVRRLAQVEIDKAVDKYPTTRYSYVEARPETGRKHQIRRHMNHLGHPIVGDVAFGKGVHNRFFESEFQSRRLLLACVGLEFAHPRTGEKVHIESALAPEFQAVVERLGWRDV
jgi:tRNA pseudouridine65 synthase